ncbi:hypothetical protein ABPG72_014709 [Tetrahymena utriculariae]
MDFKTCLAFSISSTISSALQFYLAFQLFAVDKYSMLWSTLGLILLVSISQFFVFKQDYYQHYRRRNIFWIFCFFQMEFMFVLICRQIPMSIQYYLKYRAFSEYLYSIQNLIFIFFFRSYEIKEDTNDLAINAYICMLMRFYEFSVFTIIYLKFAYLHNLYLKDCIKAFVIYLAFYLTLGSLLTIQINEQKFNLGLMCLAFILITNLISFLFNIKQIKDDNYVNSYKLLYSIACNSHPYQIFTYGQKKTSILCGFINQSLMFILLILQISNYTLDSLNQFQKLNQYQKVLVINEGLAFLLNCFYVLSFLYSFYHITFKYKSSYVSTDDDLITVSNDLSQQSLLISEVDISFKTNYQATSQPIRQDLEQSLLIPNQCNDAGCELQYNFLKAVSFQMKNKVKVNLTLHTFNICNYHNQKLLTTQESVYQLYVQEICYTERFINSSAPIEIIKERLTNGLINSQLTQYILQKLNDPQQSILRKMYSQAYQIMVFLKNQKSIITVLPELVLFDLYSIDA